MEKELLDRLSLLGSMEKELLDRLSLLANDEAFFDIQMKTEELRRKIADDIVDTSELTVHELRRTFMDLSRGGAQKQLIVTFLSFGFKHGLPLEADLVFDVRFLPNPFFVPELKALTGRDVGVQEYVNATEGAQTFQKKVSDLLDFLVPQYAAEGKSYLTVAVGCTGGRHRSVVITDQLRRHLAPMSDVRSRVKHRDIFTE